VQPGKQGKSLQHNIQISTRSTFANGALSVCALDLLMERKTTPAATASTSKLQQTKPKEEPVANHEFALSSNFQP